MEILIIGGTRNIGHLLTTADLIIGGLAVEENRSAGPSRIGGPRPGES